MHRESNHQIATRYHYIVHNHDTGHTSLMSALQWSGPSHMLGFARQPNQIQKWVEGQNMDQQCHAPCTRTTIHWMDVREGRRMGD